ncbi:hypothetical protein F511_14354 [Dorcoceras hygrometricum]|uniref:Disease resistance protein n=1 Tax=Dorcoceras hygrometricum TaxID=472368 RepID=A0A2Z7A308_9LAMI|nr:hypothetical protein F511_14354 [Dorcoceras hygrometricum]
MLLFVEGGSYCRYLTVVGSLPHLEALNLKYNAVRGREWNPVEGQFLKLKSLRIDATDLEEWVADSSHFSNLEKLNLKYLRRLKEIPYGIGEIGTLRSITLFCCSSSANASAEKILDEQQQLGNSDLQAVIGREWNPVEGQFLKLKSLRIDDTDLEEWVADSSHFPNLENLQLEWLLHLKEIPYVEREGKRIKFDQKSVGTSAEP